MMTIKELEEFAVICRKGSLAGASRELYMSPQGLSRVVKNLENELACTLVNRTASGLELTESGECLKRYAGASLEAYERLREEIAQIQKTAQGDVKLLSAYDVIRCISPESLLDFSRRYPNITFSYQEYPDRTAEYMLMEKKGNVAFSIGPFQHECFDVKVIKTCRLGMLVYEGHPLAACGSVSVEDLQDEKLYIENSSFKINELVQSRCWAKGFEPDIVFETAGFDLCYKMCREKRGVSLTVDFLHEDMNTDGLKMLPFEEADMIWEIGILTIRGEHQEESVKKFCQFIENLAASTNG